MIELHTFQSKWCVAKNLPITSATEITVQPASQSNNELFAVSRLSQGENGSAQRVFGLVTRATIGLIKGTA